MSDAAPVPPPPPAPAAEMPNVGPAETEPQAPESESAPDDGPSTTFDVERCELVLTQGDQALLRVSGRWRPTAPEHVELLRCTPASIDSIAALPPGPVTAADGSWSAAFAVDSSIGEGRLILWAGAGVGIGLPSPATRSIEPTTAPEADADPTTEEQLADALEDLADAHAVADQLRRRCELAERGVQDFRDKLVLAWGEASSLREMLDEREAAHERAKERERAARAVVDEIEQRARRGADDLNARRKELEEQCERLQAELEQRAEAEADAADHAERVASLQAEATEALGRFEAAREETAGLREELAAAQARADEAATDAARAATDLDSQRALADDAVKAADAERERASRAEHELAEAREKLAGAEATESQLAEARERLASAEQAERDLAVTRERLAAAEQVEQELGATRERLAAAEQAAAERSAAEHDLRQQLESLTPTDLPTQDEPPATGLGRRSKKVSARAYKEALSTLDNEQAQRAKLEDETARLTYHVRQLEQELAEATAASARQAATVETDLRHLLEARERELAEARTELAEQRARYASVASQVPAGEELAVPPPPVPADAEPWSAVDQDLLERIARAKALAGQD